MPKYNIIYADPPWQYNDKGCEGAAEHHYPTMPLEDIKALPISHISEKDSILFLWAVYPLLPEAFEVISVWGFKYKSVAFTWIKTSKNVVTPLIGTGHWTRGNPELCLLARKGSLKCQKKNISNVQYANRQDHSEKPMKFRNLILKLCGDLPRVELFARQKTPGWDSIGFDIDGLDITESLNKLITL